MSRLRYMPSIYVLCALLLLFGRGLAQGYNNLTEAIPQLANLNFAPPGTRNIRLGGQNFTHCCILAVNKSVELVGGDLVEADTSYISNLTVFETASANGEFPCGATYSGDHAGAPVVQVPYSFCENNCQGWQLSQATVLNQWIGPLVGFILPAVIFCLVVPRRRKLELSHKFFDARMDTLPGWVFGTGAGIIAAFLVSVDTLIWLSTCFACAGPMILSGVYEAFLDSRILHFVQHKPLTVDMRARLLYTILIGNLDLIDISRKEQWADLQKSGYQHVSTDQYQHPHHAHIQQPGQDSPWVHIEQAVNPLKIYPGARQWPLKNGKMVEFAIHDAQYQTCLTQTKTHLKSMLNCQYSFGSTIGAPVVFFAGAFIYSLADVLSRLGDDDTAHALAFGMWWMVVPHISIVSGLLLAGNNPNTLEAVIGRDAPEIEDNVWICEALGLGFGLAYPSRYKTAWMWLRGRQKRHWVDRVLDSYSLTQGSVPVERLLPEESTWDQRQAKFMQHPGFNSDVDIATDPDMEELRKATDLSWVDWCTVMFITSTFIMVPFLLAFLTSYYTPRVGVACRTLTYIVYTITQVCQIALFLIAHVNSRTSIDDTFHAPTNTSTLFPPNGPFSRDPKNMFWTMQSLRCVVWYGLALVFGAVAIFAAIGGTFMQIIGVYRNCRCKLPVQFWLNTNSPDAWVDLSTNSAQDIRDAARFWKGLGIAAMVFLGLTTYAGWWYQRRLRHLFMERVRTLEFGARRQ